MKRLQLLCVTVGLALVGVAQGQVSVGHHRVEFAHGEGVLKARDGAQVRTAFRVLQRGDSPAEGTFRFQAAGPHGSILTIASERLPRLEAREAGAVFGGHAVLEVSRTPGHEGWRWEGTVTVTVRNNTRVQVGTEWRIVDVVEVSFTTERTDRQYSFAGMSDPRNFDTGVRFVD
jgi:hypothetical protein